MTDAVASSAPGSRRAPFRERGRAQSAVNFLFLLPKSENVLTKKYVREGEGPIESVGACSLPPLAGNLRAPQRQSYLHVGEDSVAASSSSRNLQRKKGVSEPGRKSFRTKCPPGRRNIHSDHPHIRRSPLLLAGKSDQFWAGSWGEWEGLTMPVLRRGSWPLVAGSVASRGWCRQLRFSEGMLFCVRLLKLLKTAKQPPLRNPNGERNIGPQNRPIVRQKATASLSKPCVCGCPPPRLSCFALAACFVVASAAGSSG